MIEPTPHIQVTEEGVIAKTVLMAGDPLRVKYMADHILEEPVLFNTIRNMFGYTGYYKGKKVSVMGSGMGMPSIGIYSYELFNHYGVERIIRIGTAGSYTADCKVFDMVVAKDAFSESNFAYQQDCSTYHRIDASPKLTNTILETAKELGKKVHYGTIHSSDVFYRDGKSEYEKLNAEQGCLAIEMESFALFHNARVSHKEAACIVTISDSFVSHQATTAEQRQNSFTEMMILALETAIKYDN